MKKFLRSIAGLTIVLVGLVFSVNTSLAASFSRATQVGKAHLPSCGAGGFPDLAGQCWNCPAEYQHDNIFLPPTHDRVCKDSGGASFSKGIKHAQAQLGCPAGQWPSLHNGHCYSCPNGYGHDILKNGDDSRVCFMKQPQQVSYSNGKRHGKTVLGLGCPAGQWPSLHNGRCYSCPTGYDHDVSKNGDDGRVCFKRAERQTSFSQGIKYDKSNVGLCPAGQWFSLHNRACYTCPADYNHDVARSGDDDRVCFQKHQAFSQAKRVGGLLCDRGFFDPANGGSCWSCPVSQNIRTVAPVTSDRACTDRLDGLVPIDICTPLLTGVREGQKGIVAVGETLQKIAGPVLKPLHDLVEKLTPQVKTPAELGKIIDQMAARLSPFADALDEVQQLNVQLNRAAVELRNLLLNPQVVCGGNAGEIDRQLTALGLRPNLHVRKAGLFDEWPVANAHAQTKSGYAAFSVALNTLPIKEPGLPKSPINSIVVTVVTNFTGKAAVFLSLGHTFSTNPSANYSVGAMIFPSAEISDFDLIGNLGTEISFNTGLAKQFFGKLSTKPQSEIANTTGAVTGGNSSGLSRALPDSINISFDPTFRSIPGFGVSKELYTMEEAKRANTRLLDFGGISVDFSVLLAGG